MDDFFDVRPVVTPEVPSFSSDSAFSSEVRDVSSLKEVGRLNFCDPLAALCTPFRFFLSLTGPALAGNVQLRGLHSPYAPCFFEYFPPLSV